VGWIDQAVPFQDSASVAVPLVVALDPTAMQDVDKTHETPARELKITPAGAGSDSFAHPVPFHMSAKGLGAPRVPTAMHALDDVHEIPERLLLTAPVTFGVAWTAHVDPFHASASVTEVFELARFADPTAVQ
jgi:hypothetical protein